MSFLSPLFLIGAASAALPILLQRLKREPEPRVVRGPASYAADTAMCTRTG